MAELVFTRDPPLGGRIRAKRSYDLTVDGDVRTHIAGSKFGTKCEFSLAGTDYATTGNSGMMKNAYSLRVDGEAVASVESDRKKDGVIRVAFADREITLVRSDADWSIREGDERLGATVSRIEPPHGHAVIRIDIADVVPEAVQVWIGWLVFDRLRQDLARHRPL